MTTTTKRPDENEYMPELQFICDKSGPDDDTKSMMDELDRHLFDMSACMYRGTEYLVISRNAVFDDPLVRVFYGLRKKSVPYSVF